MDIKVVPVDKIVFPPEDKMLRPCPKPEDKDYDLALELQKDLEENGIMAPPTVREEGEGADTRYVVVDGARRVTMIKKSVAEGHPRFAEGVPVNVTAVQDEEALARSIAGNYHAKKTLRTQEIKALNRLAITGKKTLSELSALTGIAEPRLTAIIKINYLPEDVQEMVNTGDITLGNAIIFQKLPKDDQIDPEWIQAASNMTIAEFSSKVAEYLNDLKKEKSQSTSGESKTFVPTAVYMKKEEAYQLYEQLKYKAQSDEATEWDRGAFNTAERIFGLDEETRQAKEAAFNAEQKRKKEKAEERKKEREAKKTAQLLKAAAESGYNIVDGNGAPVDLESLGAPETESAPEA